MIIFRRKGGSGWFEEEVSQRGLPLEDHLQSQAEGQSLPPHRPRLVPENAPV